MCRLAAYLGQPIPLAEALYRPSHSLQKQAYAPRELVDGFVNVDGTGVAWWDGIEPEPLRYVTNDAPWQDANLRSLAERITSGTFVAAVRSATPGIGMGTLKVAPFVEGSLAAAHNGNMRDFRGALGQELVASLSPPAYATMQTLSDSVVLFASVVDHYSGDLVQAVTDTFSHFDSAIRRHESAATLNLVVADGDEVVAVRHSVDRPQNSLYVSERATGTWIASEPLDEGADWATVPADHLVHATAENVTIRPLESS
jgi:glutamine amidotransferase